MLHNILQRLIDQDLASVKDLSEFAGVSTSTVYRWLGGESQPDFDSIRLLLKHLPNSKAQEAILAAFTAGTAWGFRNRESDLDVNKDGVVDAADALDAAIQSVKLAGDSLTNIRESCRDGAPSMDDVVASLSILNDVIQRCTTTQQVLVTICEKRRKC